MGEEPSDLSAAEQWYFDGPPENIIVWSSPTARVCFMTSDGPAEKRARLIAAAPDLLAALQRIMAAERAASKADREALTALRFESSDEAEKLAAQTHAGHELTAAWQSARAAIAKARGAP